MAFSLRLHQGRCCWIAAVLASSLLGCSMRPLPENFPMNFPRASTYDIVQRVRCEAQEALVGLKARGGAKRREHIEQIIAATSIGYDFEFVMVEDNTLSDGALGFGRASGKKGSLSVDISGGASRQRKNSRAFRIVEDLADVEKADCSHEATTANLAYPISGSLRVNEIVRTYVQLERISNLEPGESVQEEIDDVVEGAGTREKPKTGVFAEHLEFRTTLKAGATPTLQLSAVVGSLRLTNAAVSGSVARSDSHSLIIAFAQDPDFKDRKFFTDRKFAKYRKAVAERGQILDAKAVGGARAATAFAQGTARARNRLVLELARLRNLRDDEQEGAKFLGRQLLRFLRPPDETAPDGQP
jgi:hypothetical protein